MSEKREIIQSFQTDFATINFRSDGITEVLFAEEYELTLEKLKELQDIIQKIGTQHPLYLLIVPGPYGVLTSEAKEAPMFETSTTRAIGIVTKLIHQRLLGNIYFKLKKSQFNEYKMFKSQDKAEEWLKAEIAREN